MASRNGVYYDLKASPWVYARNGLRFYFSTETHYNRFLREVDKRERQMTNTMSQRIGCFVDMRLPASVQLYRQVETRGCYIKINDLVERDGVTCLEHLRLDGLIPRYDDWSEQSEDSILL